MKGVTFFVEYSFYPGCAGTEDEPEVYDDIDVDAVWIDEFDVTHMINAKYIGLITEELFKIVDQQKEEAKLE